MKILIVTGLFLLMLCMPVKAYERDSFRKPIPFGDYVADIKPLLEEAVAANGWTFREDQDGNYFAEIEHRRYGMKTALLVESKEVSIKLLSVTKKRGKTKVNNKVRRWLIMLRRSIALGITVAVRDDADRRRNKGQ